MGEEEALVSICQRDPRHRDSCLCLTFLRLLGNCQSKQLKVDQDECEEAKADLAEDGKLLKSLWEEAAPQRICTVSKQELFRARFKDLLFNCYQQSNLESLSNAKNLG